MSTPQHQAGDVVKVRTDAQSCHSLRGKTVTIAEVITRYRIVNPGPEPGYNHFLDAADVEESITDTEPPSMTITGKLADFFVLVTQELDRAQELHAAHWPVTNLPDWGLILGEETGEAQKAIIEYMFTRGPLSDVSKESLQVAAMAFKLWEHVHSAR